MLSRATDELLALTAEQGNPAVISELANRPRTTQLISTLINNSWMLLEKLGIDIPPHEAEASQQSEPGEGRNLEIRLELSSLPADGPTRKLLSRIHELHARLWGWIFLHT